MKSLDEAKPRMTETAQAFSENIKEGE